jgi:protein-S-isoprenylcysteine O-methyltransferase Ste14
MLGIFISSGSSIIALNGVILFMYYFLSAMIEEKAIIQKFPGYSKYKTKTGMFFPSVIKGMLS